MTATNSLKALDHATPAYDAQLLRAFKSTPGSRTNGNGSRDYALDASQWNSVIRYQQHAGCSATYYDFVICSLIPPDALNWECQINIVLNYGV